MVGAAIVRNLSQQGFTNIISRQHSELDLVSQADVAAFFQTEKPQLVVLAAARVGGIYDNNS